MIFPLHQNYKMRKFCLEDRKVWFQVIGRLQNWCGDKLFFFFLFIFLDQMSHFLKKLFKTQHGKISIDPAILAAIGHRFTSKKTKN